MFTKNDAMQPTDFKCTGLGVIGNSEWSCNIIMENKALKLSVHDVRLFSANHDARLDDV